MISKEFCEKLVNISKMKTYYIKGGFGLVLNEKGKKRDKVIYSKAREMLESKDLNLSILKGRTEAQKKRLAEIVKEMEEENKK